MAKRNGARMVYRYSWIAGISAIALALWELSFLMRDSETGTPWPIAILVATLLGAGITWTAIAYRAHAAVIAAANVVAFVITVGLLVAPETLLLVVPTPATWDAVVSESRRAIEIIQYGVEPVRPVPGLVMLIAGLFWTLGFLLVAGLLNSRPFVAVVTPLIVALQFVIIDRRPKSISHLGVFIGIVALSLLAIRVDERDSGAGKLQRVNSTRKPTTRPSPAIGILLIATVAISLAIVGVVGSRVPSDGILEWREPAGFSDEYSGSASYNPYADIQSGLISQTKNPLFTAVIEGADPGQVRYKTVTLDRYRNGRWMTDRVKIYPLDEEPWIEPIHEYRGETVTITADITIQNLRQPWIPAPDTPVAAFAEDDSDTAAMRVRRLDGTLMLPGDATYPGMQYAVLAEMPRYDGPTIAALSLAQDGQLSPLFAAAADGGEDLIDLTDIPEPLELDNEEFWLNYPAEELGTAFTVFSQGVVGNTSTNFEKALLLENFFRDSGTFVYSDSVPPENTTDDVLAWLTDDTNDYMRHGYCEQFATAMGLMARAVGVPSRVVLGFTPGTTLNDTMVQVTDKNAHSWVELWIPNFGWMSFDPTPRALYSATTANDELSAALGFSPVAYAEDIPDPTLIDQGTADDIGPDAGRFGPQEDVERFRATGGGGSETAGSGISLPGWALVVLVFVAIVLAVLLAAPIVQWWKRQSRKRRLDAGDVTAAWEDIVERLVDLKEPIHASSTPLEAATNIDPAFVPLATAYGHALYGDEIAGSSVATQALDAHERATQHLTTRYSRGERIKATYRPTKLIVRWKALRSRLRR